MLRAPNRDAPFFYLWVAADTVTYCDPCIGYVPTFGPGPDGALCMVSHDGEIDGQVRAVHRAGPVALVELDHLPHEDDPALVALVLVRVDSLPAGERGESTC